ncbi:MAG: glycine cleavage system aminomethyltransferase GcvT [Actinobacteria bacterium]|nr:glycine cleavage system aminomethyltransferase GcvT [Actinomycetota bacterium]
MVDFAGWYMPVQYAGIVEEHNAVRNHAGLFDVSHMGELWIEGPEAAQALSYALVSDPARQDIGRARYSMICADDGGIIDDLIVYRLGDQRYLVVANAGTALTVASELHDRIADFEASIDDASSRTSLLALQGPAALAIMAGATEADVAALPYYSMTEGAVGGIAAHIARTGYTGEDGFEIFVSWDDGPALWDALMAAGRDRELSPVGLGARDTLRLEAGMPLYGNELDLSTNPYEAGLGRVVALDKAGGFVGRHALKAASQEPPSRKLVGLKVTGRGIARHGYPVIIDGEPRGIVTSGTQSPTLGVPVAMAYVPVEASEPGTALDVEIRGKQVAAEIAPLPFYRRKD